MKRILSLILTLALLCALFSGCKTQPPAPEVADLWVDDGEPATIKVLTERFMWSDPADIVLENKTSHLLGSLNRIIDYYEHEHPSVTVEVEYATISSSTRETEMEARRVALMGGDVPDIYLMPTMSDYEFYEGRKMNGGEYPFLFRDLGQAMTNSWFADIAPYYNGDTELHTEELKQGVMDAGVLDGKRLVLPLGYDMTLLLFDNQELEGSTMDLKSIESGYLKLLEHVASNPEPRWSYAASGSGIGLPLSYLPQICDYPSEKVLLGKESVVDFLKVKRDSLDSLNQYMKDFFDSHPDIEYLWIPSVDWYLSGVRANPSFYPEVPVLGTPLSQAVDSMAVCKAQGYDVTALPIRDTDGKLSADITYWGAVSSGSQNIPLAYDFLRLFLTPEVQFGGQLTCGDGTTFKTGFQDKTFGTEALQIHPGWPVRSSGAVAARWAKIRIEAEAKERSELLISDKPSQNTTAMLSIEVTEEDLPFLAEEVDRARFPSVVDLWFYRMENDVLYPQPYGEAEPLTDEEISKLAEDFLRELRYHLAEG